MLNTRLTILLILLAAATIVPPAPALMRSTRSDRANHLRQQRRSSVIEGERKLRRTNRTGNYVIRGMVRDVGSGGLISGLRVKAFNNIYKNGRPLATAQTNKQGRFNLTVGRGVSTIEVFLSVFNRGGQAIASIDSPITVSANSDVGIDINLLSVDVNPTRSLSGLVNIQRSSIQGLASQVSGRELVQVHRALNRGDVPPESLNPAQRALIRLLKVRFTDDCGEGPLSLIELLLKERNESHLLSHPLCVYPADTIEKQFFTEHVAVTYTTHPAGLEVVDDPLPPLTDEPFDSPDGPIGIVRANLSSLHPDNCEVPPAYVQQVGLLAEHAWHRFVNAPMSFRDPRGGEPRIKITICQTAYAGATTPNADFIEINPRNKPIQNFATVPHEVFHRVQYQYNSTYDRFGLYGAMREGGARFIEDAINDRFNRYVFQSQRIFTNPMQSLVTPLGSYDPFIESSAALFWKYLAEQHSMNIEKPDEPDIGVDVYRQVLETTATPVGSAPQPYAPASLRTACAMMARPGSFDEFKYLDPATAELDTNETSWGNYLLANHLHGSPALPPGESRFSYLEDQDNVNWPDPPIVSRLATLSAMIASDDNLILGGGSSITRVTKGQLPYAAKYFRITPDTSSPPRMLRMSLSAFGGMTDPLIQILRFGPDGVLTDISKSDQPSYMKTINMNGLSSVIVIVASRMNAGDYTVNFDEVPGGSDVMITRWNSALGTEYELNPRDWTRTSPDLIVDSNGDGVPDPVVIPGINNKLKVRLHNRGNMSISGIRINLDYQPAIPQLRTDLWLPAKNAANVTQSITNISLTPGQSHWAVVDWAPTGSASGWCVKATVDAPGDLNNDNKIAIGCFNRSP